MKNFDCSLFSYFPLCPALKSMKVMPVLISITNLFREELWIVLCWLLVFISNLSMFRDALIAAWPSARKREAYSFLYITYFGKAAEFSMIYPLLWSILFIYRILASKSFQPTFFWPMSYTKGCSFCNTLHLFSLSIRLSKDFCTYIYSFYAGSIQGLCNDFHIEHDQRHLMFSIFLTSLASIKSISHLVGHYYQILLSHICY